MHILVLTIYDHSFYTEPTLFCDDETNELSKQLKKEQKDDMAQDIDNIKSKACHRYHTLIYTQ